MVLPLGRRSVSKSTHLVSSQPWTWKFAVVVMLGNTEISRVVTRMSPWTYCRNLTVWTRWESYLQSKKIIWEDQERGWLPLWLSSPKQGQRNTKSQGMPLEMSARRILQILLGSLRNYLIRVMRVGGPNMSLLTVTFTQQDILWSVWWELMPSTLTINLQERKWLLRNRSCP